MSSAIPILLSCTLTLSVLSGKVYAAEESSSPAARWEFKELQLINADVMTLSGQPNEPQVFKGNVELLVVGERFNNLSLKADKVDVHYSQDARQVSKVVAEGHVVITRNGSRATTELAVFHIDTNRLELLVDPKVVDAQGEITANKMTLHIDTDTVVAEGNVKGVLYPRIAEKEE